MMSRDSRCAFEYYAFVFPTLSGFCYSSSMQYEQLTQGKIARQSFAWRVEHSLKLVGYKIDCFWFSSISQVGTEQGGDDDGAATSSKWADAQHVQENGRRQEGEHWQSREESKWIWEGYHLSFSPSTSLSLSFSPGRRPPPPSSCVPYNFIWVWPSRNCPYLYWGRSWKQLSFKSIWIDSQWFPLLQSTFDLKHKLLVTTSFFPGSPSTKSPRRWFSCSRWVVVVAILASVQRIIAQRIWIQGFC